MIRKKPLFLIKNGKILAVLLVMVMLYPTLAFMEGVNHYVYEVARVLNIIGVVVIIVPHIDIFSLSTESEEAITLIQSGEKSTV